MITDKEISQYAGELQRLVAQMQNAPPGSASGIREDLEKLAVRIGACTRGICGGQLAPVDTTVLAQNIHEALQTASMIDACRTAAKNHEIAVKAQESAQLSQWIALGAMAAAVATAIAAWVWH